MSETYFHSATSSVDGRNSRWGEEARASRSDARVPSFSERSTRFARLLRHAKDHEEKARMDQVTSKQNKLCNGVIRVQKMYFTVYLKSSPRFLVFTSAPSSSSSDLLCF